MGRTGKHEFGYAQLSNATQSLEFWLSDQFPSELVHRLIVSEDDQTVHWITQALGARGDHEVNISRTHQ